MFGTPSSSTDQSSSADPSSKKLGLDARAAELKRQLLKSRAQKERTASASPAQSSPPAVRQPSNMPRITGFVPHALPRQPTQTSVSADEEDIHDLIRSSIAPKEDHDPKDQKENDNEQGSHEKTDQKQNDIDRPARADSPEEGEIVKHQNSGPVSANKENTTGVSAEKNQVSPRIHRGPRGENGSVQERSVKVVNGKRNLQPQPQPQPQTRGEGNGTQHRELDELVARDKDLRDWLLLTDYYNIDTRNRELERYRKQKQLDAEERNRKLEQYRSKQMQLEAEMKKLEAAKLKLQEEAAEMGFQNPVATQTSSTSSAISRSSTNAGVSNGISGVSPGSRDVGKSTPAAKNSETMQAIPVKREYDAQGEGGQLRERQDKKPRIDDRRNPDSKRSRSQSRGEDHRDLPRGRAPGSPRHQSQRYDNDYRRSPPRPREPRYRQDFGYDSYRRESFQPPIRPQGRGTRYFILKSFNDENVRKCMEDGVWATQVANGPVLTAAFAKSKEVILFYSVNKSKAFQGIARMTTTPSPDTPRPQWMKGIQWDTTSPFRVEWLSKEPVEFYRIGHLKNSLNEDLPVLVGRDGQEVEEECGRALVHEMQKIADIRRRPRSLSPEYRSRNGYARDASRGRQGFVKREHDYRERW